MSIKVTFSQAADALLSGRTVWSAPDLRVACGLSLARPMSKRRARRRLELFRAICDGEGFYLREGT